MAFDLEKAEALLSSLGMDLVMISSGNLVEVSGLLGRLEGLTEAFAPLESDLPGRILEALAEGLKAVLEGRTTRTDEALALVGDGLTFLSDLARSLPVKGPFQGDLAAFEANLAKLADAPGFWAEIEKEALEAEAKAETVVFQAHAGPGPEELSLENFKTQFIPMVEELQVLLVTIEQKNDPHSALGELVRPFRAILGAATLVQFPDASDLAYNAADLIEYVINDHLTYSTGVTDILLSTCNYMLKGLYHLQIHPDEAGGWILRPGPEAYTREELNSFNERLWAARQGITPQKPLEEKMPSIGFPHTGKPKKIGEILVAQGLISKGDLGGLIAAQQSERKVTLGDILIKEKIITKGDLEEALGEQKKRPHQKIGEILILMGKVEAEQIEEVLKRQEERREAKLGEFLLKSKMGAPEKVAMALREQKSIEGGPSIAAQTVKVETTKLDGLIDLVGELVIGQSLINSSTAISLLKEQKLNKDLAQVSRITSELQRNAMSLRMIPISPTFQKMNRLVRDLAHKFEKNVRFEAAGGDTEVDRNVVDSIYDPLVHLVRNALDHGLEGPDERLAAGKSPQGMVRLNAYHQSGNVVIELSDDGRGLDTEKVLRKATEKGLVNPGKIMNSAAIHALVFQPGFSTADKITDVSGRGVGLDVVSHSIEKLRGKVDFISSRGRGSTMTIRLPLTLAIIDGMIVRVGEHRYILPTVSIVESFRPAPSSYFTVQSQGEMIKVREQLTPLIRLDRLVGAEGGVSRPEDGLIVVVESEKGETRCLLVDEVLGKQEVVIKSLGERLKHIRSLAGGTILGDGRVGLILDVAGLCDEAAGTSAGGGSSGASQPVQTFEFGAEDWDM